MLSQNEFFKGIVSRNVSCHFVGFLMTEMKQGGHSVQNMIFLTLLCILFIHYSYWPLTAGIFKVSYIYVKFSHYKSETNIKFIWESSESNSNSFSASRIDL
jgi:hypothetical protein